MSGQGHLPCPTILSTSTLPAHVCRDGWREGCRGEQETLSPSHMFQVLLGGWLWFTQSRGTCVPNHWYLSAPGAHPAFMETFLPSLTRLVSPAQLCSNLSLYSPNLNSVPPPLQAPCHSQDDSLIQEG